MKPSKRRQRQIMLLLATCLVGDIVPVQAKTTCPTEVHVHSGSNEANFSIGALTNKIFTKVELENHLKNLEQELSKAKQQNANDQAYISYLDFPPRSEQGAFAVLPNHTEWNRPRNRSSFLHRDFI
ncbi:hypothetical protein [Burkholderia sp. Bp8998]|uniref:hypothetical protein n=1 Tax=Burkholderia sp. Bp8998 TaxID=2184557 RepID=UPI000F5A2866|nr:hypothetical protein [Burkholderia sp. Bp8998]